MNAKQIIAKHEPELGPWLRTDAAADVLADIRQLDPEDAAMLTLSDVRAYLNAKPCHYRR